MKGSAMRPLLEDKKPMEGQSVAEALLAAQPTAERKVIRDIAIATGRSESAILLERLQSKR